MLYATVNAGVVNVNGNVASGAYSAILGGTGKTATSPSQSVP